MRSKRPILIAVLSSQFAFQLACSGTYAFPEGVQVDAVKFTKTVFFQADGMNLVSELRVADVDGDGKDEIVVLASDGIRLLDFEAKQKRFTAFQSQESVWAAASVSRAARAPAYVGNLPNQRQIVLFDDAGRIVWSAPGDSYDQPAVGDVDGDGRNEIVAKSRTDRLQIINLDGQVLREFGPGVAPLFYRVADMDGDGKADIVGESGSNEISITAGDGRSLPSWIPPHAFYQFFPARLPGRSLPTVMFLSDDAEELVFLDAAGAVVKTLKAPMGNHLAIPMGFSMVVSGKKDGFVCLASSRGSTHHHVLYVFNSDDQLVYLDSVADDAMSLVVAQGAGSSADPAILVGGRNTIWKYAPR